MDDSAVASQMAAAPDSAVAGQMTGTQVSAVAGQMPGAPDPVAAGDPTVAGDEAANDAVQGDEREEQVNVKLKQAEDTRAAAQHPQNVANFKKGDPHAMFPSKQQPREA